MAKTVTIKYQPQPHQLKWHQNPTRFLVAVTGRQIGKTTAAVNELIIRALVGLCPECKMSKTNCTCGYSGGKSLPVRVWYITNDYKQAKRNVWDEFKRYMPKEAMPKYNESELKIVTGNGSKIELIGVDNAESLRGAAVHFMILDEYADFARHVWPEVLSKMFTTTRGDAWFIGTPKGLGNDLHDKFYANDKSVTSYRMPGCTVKEGKVTACLSEYADMETIQHALETDPWDTFRQEYLADFTKPAGTVYDEWDLKRFTKVDYDPNLPVHLAFDFGVNDPTSIIWIQPFGGEYRVIDYYEKRNSAVSHFVQVIKAKPYREPELCVGDQAGNSRSIESAKSPIEAYAEAGVHIRTKHISKIQDQIAACHRIIPSLYVASKLSRFRDCLLNYRYPSDDEKRTKLNTSKENPIHDEFSHAMRALEYYAVNISDFGGKAPVIVGYEEGLGGARMPKYEF